MVRPGVNQLARQLALVLIGLSLVGYLGWLLSGLYRSNQELQQLRQEELVQSSVRRAGALAYFLSERAGDLTTLAEDRSLQAYFENKALGMSMEYGLSASLYAIRDAFGGLVAKRRLGGHAVYQRLAFVDDAGRVLADVDGLGHPVELLPEEPAAWAALLGPAGGAPRFGRLGRDLVVSVPYQFRPGQGGHLLGWVAVDDVIRRLLGVEDPATRVTVVYWDDRPAFQPEEGPRLPAEVLEAAGRLAGGARARLASGGAAWLAVRSEVAGSPLALLAFIPEDALGTASPVRLLLFTGLLGALIVGGGLAWALAARRAQRGLEELLERLPFAVVVVARREVALGNAEARRLLAAPGERLEGRPWSRYLPEGQVRPGAGPQEVVVTGGDGERRPVLLAEVPAWLGDQPCLVEAFVDLSERRALEAQLRQAQKLEAVGQLAAGIAHELNTPIQFVGDSVRFLQEGFAALLELTGAYRRALPGLAREAGRPEAARALAQAEDEADVAYLEENVSPAFARTLDGLSRVASIVGAMKEFAHPDQGQKAPADLNRALQTTLTIARNEYKYVADVETDLGPLPLVECHVGALNQVFLNLIVNAAHAIADRVGSGGGRGLIRVRSACADGRVRIEVTDDGCGVPEAIRDRIFDPFFTTKEVGRGTGQGLSIARSIVVDRHGGRLDFTSEAGRGATFWLELPIRPADAPPAPAPAAGAAANGRTAGGGRR